MTDDERNVYSVPLQGYGTIHVAADDPEAAVEVAEEHADPSMLEVTFDANHASLHELEPIEPGPYVDPVNVDDEEEDSGQGYLPTPSFDSVTDLREARRSLDVTQKEIGNALGVSPSTVGRWEREDREIPLSQARRYASVLRNEKLSRLSSEGEA